MHCNRKPAKVSSPRTRASGWRRRTAALLGAAVFLPIAALISCASVPQSRPAAGAPPLTAQFGTLSHPGGLARFGNLSVPLPLGWSVVRKVANARLIVRNQAGQVRAIFTWIGSRPGLDTGGLISYLLRLHGGQPKGVRGTEVKSYLLDGYPASLAVPPPGHTVLLAVGLSRGIVAGEFRGTGRALIPELSLSSFSTNARVREHLAFFGLTPSYPWHWYSDLGDGFVLASRYQGGPLFLAIYDPRTHKGGVAAASSPFRRLSAPATLFLDALPVTTTPAVAAAQNGGRLLRMRFSYEGRPLACELYLPRAQASFDYGSLLASSDLRNLFRLHVTVGDSVRWKPDLTAVNLVPRPGARR